MPSRSFEVLLSAGAEHDLEVLYDFIAEFDSPERADYVLDAIDDSIRVLVHFPERGSYPSELLELGIKEFRQISFKPHRVIYRATATQVIVYLIADDRRNLQALLNRRLLQA